MGKVWGIVMQKNYLHIHNPVVCLVLPNTDSTFEPLNQICKSPQKAKGSMILYRKLGQDALMGPRTVGLPQNLLSWSLWKASGLE